MTAWGGGGWGGSGTGLHTGFWFTAVQIKTLRCGFVVQFNICMNHVVCTFIFVMYVLPNAL